MGIKFVNFDETAFKYLVMRRPVSHYRQIHRENQRELNIGHKFRSQFSLAEI